MRLAQCDGDRGLMQDRRRGEPGIQGGRIMRRLMMAGWGCRENAVYRGPRAVVLVASLS